MAKLKKTPKQAMKYWSVGWNGVVIKARTARVAARKWLRDSAMTGFLIRECELDNPGGSGEMPHEAATRGHGGLFRGRSGGKSGILRRVESDIRKMAVADVPVREVPKCQARGPSAPNNGTFWSGFNRR